jgi:hypothetical protein
MQEYESEEAVSLDVPMFFVALDLGQSADYSALVVLERRGNTPEQYTFNCRYLQRWELRTSYPKIVGDVLQLVNSPTLARNNPNRTVLAIDATGVGAPVIDLFKREKTSAKLIPIQITAGSEVNTENGTTRIPKRNLVSAVSIALQSGKLKIAKKLTLAGTLIGELENFKAKITASGNDTYGAGAEWRVGNNDDLVLALAMAIWCAAQPVYVYEVKRSRSYETYW